MKMIKNEKMDLIERVKNISEKYDAKLSENIKKDLTEILSAGETSDTSKSLDLLAKKNKFGFRAEYSFIHRVALHPSFHHKRESEIYYGSSKTKSCVVYNDVILSYEQFICLMESGEILFANNKKDNKSKITQKIKGALTTIGHYAALGTCILGMYSVLTIGLPCAMRAGLESIDRTNEKTIEARVLDKGEVRLLQTKGILAYAELKTQQGEMLRVYDDASVLKGKIFANTIVPGLEEGKNYYFRVQESKLGGDSYCIEAKITQ